MCRRGQWPKTGENSYELLALWLVDYPVIVIKPASQILNRLNFCNWMDWLKNKRVTHSESKWWRWFLTNSAQVHFSDHVITPVVFTEDLLTNDLKTSANYKTNPSWFLLYCSCNMKKIQKYINHWYVWINIKLK